MNPPVPEANRRPEATASFLEAIVAAKRIEVARKRAAVPLEEMRQAALRAAEPRNFVEALRAKVRANGHAVIAEFKRASPSKGTFRGGLDPASTAKAFEQGGAACMSVLTDQQWFGARSSDLEIARSACSLPVLRKDFIVDAYQVYESRAMGADCVLLIAACLSDTQLSEFGAIAEGLGIAAIVEVHGAQELPRALRLAAALIGINSRNLHSFDVSLQGVADLGATVQPDRLLIAESGIANRGDVRMLRNAGLNVFLVGEALMRAADPVLALGELVHAAGAPSIQEGGHRIDDDS